MTSPSDPRELASDVVDGLLSADDAARALEDPEVAAHVEAFRQVREAMRDVPPPGELARASAVSAALSAALDTGQGHPGGPAGPPPVTDLAHRRRHGRTWLAAAAAVAVLALTAGLILRQGGDGTEVNATGDSEGSAEESVDQDAGSAGSDDMTAGDEAPEPMAEDESSARADDGLPYLGSLADAGQLADAVTSAYDAPPVTPTEGALEDDVGEAGEGDGEGSCPALAPAGDPERGRADFSATAHLDGEWVVVHRYPLPDGGFRLTATTTDCRDLVDQQVDAE